MEVDINDEDQTIPVPDHLNDSQLSLLTDKNFDHSIQSEPSLHPSSDSEVEEDKPEAVFEVREHIVKTGSQKGKIQKIIRALKLNACIKSLFQHNSYFCVSFIN